MNNTRRSFIICTAVSLTAVPLLTAIMYLSYDAIIALLLLEIMTYLYLVIFNAAAAFVGWLRRKLQNNYRRRSICQL